VLRSGSSLVAAPPPDSLAGTPHAVLRSTSLADTATTPDASDGGGSRGGGLAPGVGLDAGEPADTEDEGYSSYSDMEPDPGPGYLGSAVAARLTAGNGKVGSGATGAAAAAAAAAAALPDLSAVLGSISRGATRSLWPAAGGGAAAAAGDRLAAASAAGGGAAAAAGGGAASGGAPSDAATSGPSTSGAASGGVSGGGAAGKAGAGKAQRARGGAAGGRAVGRATRTSAWKEARRGIEWRARWLQLRLRGLAHQRDRHAAALAELQVWTSSL